MPATSGSPTQIATSQPTKVALSGTPADQFQGGDLGYVQEEFVAGRCALFALVPTGGPAVNGSTVLSVYQNSAARWVSLALVAPSSTLVVPNIAALAALDAAGFPSGQLVNVQTLRSAGYFVLDKSSPATPDNITVVAALNASGNWLREKNVSMSWTYQVTWYVDPTAGDDEAVGNTALTAIKTVAELARRLTLCANGTTYVINVLGDIPVTDSFVPTVTLAGNPSATTTVLTSGTTFQFIGVRTVVRSGTFAAGTQQTDPTRAAATAQAEAVDAGVATWATDVGNMIVNQDSKTAWVLTAKGGGTTARVTDWVTSAFAWTTAPAVGNTYSVVTLTRWRAPFSVQGAAQGAQTLVAQILFDNFHFDNLQLQRLSYGSAAIVFTRTCKFSNEQASLAGAPTNTLNLPCGLVQNMKARLVMTAAMIMNYGTGVAGVTLSLGGSSSVFNPGSGAIKARFFYGDGNVFFQGLCIQAGWVQVGTSSGEPPTGGVNFGTASSNGGWLGIYNDYDLPGGSGILAAIQVGKLNTATIVNSVYGVGDGVTVIRGLYVRDGARVGVLSTIFERGSGSETTTTCWNLQASGAAQQLDIDSLAVTLPNITASAGAVLPATAACTTFNQYRTTFTRNMQNYANAGGIFKYA